MRIVGLDLLAFGPFSGASLDFDDTRPRLHVVHGGNAAGKSTTLRALEGLLFGIPERTGDAHRHPPNQLRIGARLASASGEVLSVVRRKGRRNTLLDTEGEPVDEARLSALLRGVGPERFRTVFALDAERLRRGAQALLAGGGDVGESLFDAGGGGHAISALLAELEAEADALYTHKARKRSLNEALAAFRAARGRRQSAELGADAWRQQLAEIEAKQARRDELRAARHELLAERSRIERIRRTAPLLAQRDEAQRALEALGQLVDVPTEAVDERHAVEALLQRCEHERSKAEQGLAANAAERAALSAPGELLSLADARVEELHESLGRYRSAQADLPKRRAELAALQAEVADLMRRLGREEHTDDPETLRLDVASQARIRKLAAERRALQAHHEDAVLAVAEDEARLALLVAEGARAGAPPDATAVEACLSRARPLAVAAQAFEDQGSAFDRRREDVEARRIALQLERTSLAAVERMPVPSSETVERFEDEYRDLVRDEQRLAERRDDLARRQAQTRGQRQAEAQLGELPTEAQLTEARAERARLWEALEQSGSLTGPEARAYRQAVDGADELADRLRREAGRVARHAELVAREAEEEADERSLAAVAEELAGRRAEHERSWASLWEPCGVEPRPPADMRGWLRRFSELRAGVRAFLETELERQQLEGDVQAVGRQLADALVAARKTVPDPVTLPALVDQGDAFLRSVGEAVEEHSRRRAAVAEVEQRLAEARRPRAEQAEARLVAWQKSWSDSVAALALAGDVDPEQAEAVLDVLAELFPKLDGAARLGRRIESMERDGRAFTAEVDELTATHLPGLDEGSVTARAESLVRRHREAREHERAGERLAVRQRELEGELAELGGEAASARARFERLLEAAGASDREALLEAEQRAARARELVGRLAELDERLLEEGAGAELETLRAETRAVDIDEVNARAEEIGRQLPELDEQHEETLAELARLKAGRDRQRDDETAAEAAAEVESQLARVSDLARRWLRLRVAAIVLRQQIERYREENQGPILRRAAELFPRLTCGRCTELKAGFGDGEHPVLLCVEADGAEKTVDQLSKGTADQLYLALRLASLEHHATRDEPLPLVLDDVLVQFDQPSARAALEILGELTATTQVLLFTHHDHVVDLARLAVAPDALAVHHLGERRAGVGDDPSPAAEPPRPPTGVTT